LPDSGVGRGGRGFRRQRTNKRVRERWLGDLEKKENQTTPRRSPKVQVCLAKKRRITDRGET